jgi:Restriction endonuclease
MGYYEDKKRELESLIELLSKEKEYFASAVRAEKSAIEKLKDEQLRAIKTAQAELEEKEAVVSKLRDGVVQMARERQVGFPWLANAYNELFALEEKLLVHELKTKSRPAISAAEVVKEQSQKRRAAERALRISENILALYEHVAPFLLDLREEVDDPTEESRRYFEAFTEEERQDGTTQYLTKEEFLRLSASDRNQLALDRYWKRPKSKVEIGKIYERYIGYLFEMDGYDVDFHGISHGLEDLGRDLVCTRGKDVVLVQCKYWSDFRTIYEKHIFQFFGTVFQYKDSHPFLNVHAAFYTTTQLSELARRFAKELNIQLEENFKFDPTYPAIKCNVSRSGERIYHLPFDQQYDRTKIIPSNGELYAQTIAQAESAGFRRAFRYQRSNDN